MILKTVPLKVISILGLIVILFACDSDSEPPLTIPTVTGILVIDSDNNGNASDLLVSFNKPLELTGISEFRVFIVKDAAVFGSFDLATASAVVATNYVRLGPNEIAEDISFVASSTDTDSELIEEGIAYRIFVLTVAESGITEDNALAQAGSPITLAQLNTMKTLVPFINAGSGGMDADTDGNIYMADFGASLGGPPGTTVYKITPTGDVSIFATGLVGASGNDFDSEGNLFQSNIGGGSISKIAPDGSLSEFANSSSGLAGPVGIVIDDNDDLYVVNCTNNNILKFTKSGQVSVFSSGSIFQCPNGITMAPNGQIYVANFGNGSVVEVSPDGSATILATIPGGNNGHLLYHAGFLFVVARANHQIYKVDLTGTVEVFAGTGQRGDRNGVALNATMSLPNDLAFSPDGTKMYINCVAGTNPNASVISPVAIKVVEIVEPL